MIRMINTPGHLRSVWPLCKRSDRTLTEVSQHAYVSYLALSLPLIYHHIDLLQPDVTGLISIDVE